MRLTGRPFTPPEKSSADNGRAPDTHPTMAADGESSVEAGTDLGGGFGSGRMLVSVACVFVRTYVLELVYY